MDEIFNEHAHFSQKIEGKRSLRVLRCRWECNIKTGL